jgi:lipopolysaccharide heptosyltransferase II
MKPAGRILIVNQNWMGDVLFSTPALRAIRKNFPQSFISCLVPDRAAEVLRHNPHLNEVLIYDERASPTSFYKSARLWLRIRRRNFDSVFFFHRSRSKTFLAMLAGIPERIGFALPGRRRFLTMRVPYPSGETHKTDVLLHLVQFAGIRADGRELDFQVTSEEKRSLQKKLMDEGLGPNDLYAVLHAGGNWSLKRWPIEYFIRWTGLFLKETGWKVVICGTASEEELARQITARYPGGNVISLCGKTTLGELAALMDRAKFLISNDSGPIHLAASQRVRLLGLYGPTTETLTGPISAAQVRVLRKDVGCEVPCYFRDCDHRVCMELLSPEEVFEHTRELIRA